MRSARFRAWFGAGRHPALNHAEKWTVILARALIIGPVTNEPESRAEARISAGEAGRTFAAILDQIEAGRRFLVYRDGRDVCVMAPLSVERRRASECLAVLRQRAAVRLDDGFSRDLLDALATEPTDERPSWES